MPTCPCLLREHLAVVLEELARVSASYGVTIGVNGLPQVILLRYGTEQQRQRYLAGLVSGELLGAFALIFSELFPKREVQALHIDGNDTHRNVHGMNLCLMGLVAVLLASGLVTGINRYLNLPIPTWLDWMPYGLLIFGGGVAFFLLRLLWSWLPFFLRARALREWSDEESGAAPTVEALPGD